MEWWNEKRWNDGMIKWWLYEMMKWLNDGMIENDLIEWRNDVIIEWWNDGMMEWWNDGILKF